MSEKDFEKLAVTIEEKGDSRYHFQVNLGGMLDILSNHLYKSPDVFVRELLQNGVDAITMRQKGQPEWNGGSITITVVPGRRIEFSDNGAGLTEEEIHRFLAVIGSSSKTQLVNGEIPEDYIGRFGIGLLSCFMVSDSIVMHTVPTDGSQANVWTGFPDGTYTLEPLTMDQTNGTAGTTVILNAKKGEEHYFQSERLAELVRYYGMALPVPVYLSGNPKRINHVPADFSGIGRSQLLSFGSWIFDDEFLDGIPIQTPHLSGVAYILPYRTDPSMKGGHRIYLKHMLLTEEGNTLLPSWAFFLRCFLNTQNLRPTASREDFYEDQALAEAREEFEEAVRYYLESLAQDSPERLSGIVNTHVEAIKSMAVWDDRMFHLFIDYLPFETSEGSCTGSYLKHAGEAEWISSVPGFQQLAGRTNFCNDAPKLYRYYYLEDALDRGDLKEAIPYANQLSVKLEHRIHDLSFLGAVVRCFAYTDLDKAVKKFESGVKLVLGLWDQIKVYDYYKGAYVCFHELAKVEDTVTLQLPDEFPLYAEEGVYSCKALEGWFYEQAEGIGDRFDNRNGSHYFKKNLAKAV